MNLSSFTKSIFKSPWMKTQGKKIVTGATWAKDKTVSFKAMGRGTKKGQEFVGSSKISGAGYKKKWVSGVNTYLAGKGLKGKALRFMNIVPFGGIKTHFLVGSVAMAGLSIMNGGMSQANDIMMERYMQDARYSNSVMRNGSLGKSTKAPGLSIGNHVGLSLSLSRTRHGY